MAGKFTVEVPLDNKSSPGIGGSSAGKDSGGLAKGMKNLNKSVQATFDINKILAAILGDVFKMLSPLVKILSILLLLVFLPLMPVMKVLLNILKMAIIGWKDLSQKLTTFVQWLVDLPVNLATWIWDIVKKGFGILKDVGIWIWDMLVKGFEILKDIGVWVWENIIVPSFSFLLNAGVWIWETFFLKPLMFLKDIGVWIWDKIIKPAWDFIKDIGIKIWNIIKTPFEWLASKVSSIVDKIKNFGGKVGKVLGMGDGIVTPQGDVIQTDPRDYIIATKTPGALIGGGGATININNPSVRNDADIRKIAQQVSQVMRRQLGGRVSTQ